MTCLRKSNIMHGFRYHPLYKVWINMKTRCYNKNNPGYKNYGAKGVRIFKKWFYNFLEFYDWAVDNGWKYGLVIDRKDCYGNYVPSNCRFVTSMENSRNQRLLQSHNTSGYRGVCWNGVKWQTQIKINGKQTYLGTFSSLYFAAIIYDIEALVLDDGRPLNVLKR